MLSFLAKKDKKNKNINLHKPKVPPTYWTFFAKTYHANDRDNNMSLFTNSSRQLRRITEQSISILKVSQNANTILHLSFLLSKSKTYHGRYEKYTSILTFRMQHSTHSVYLERTTNCSSSPRRRYFSYVTKNTFHKSTRKVKTQNNNVFILE